MHCSDGNVQRSISVLNSDFAFWRNASTEIVETRSKTIYIVCSMIKTLERIVVLSETHRLSSPSLKLRINFAVLQ